MNESFEENIKVLSEWSDEYEEFRLVNLGAGPYQLQVKKFDEWVKEKRCFEWGVLCHQLIKLTVLKEKE